MILTQCGIRIAKTAINCEKLTYSKKLHKDRVRTAKNYKLLRDCALIPRFCSYALTAAVTNAIASPAQLSHIKYENPTGLSQNQKLVMRELFTRYFTKEQAAAGLAGAIVDMRPGMGKTHILMATIGLLKLPTCVVVPTKLLAQQIAQSCARYLPTTYVSTNVADAATADVLILVINTAYKQDAVFFTRFGIMAYDEAHKYHGDAMRELFWKCQRTYSLGLSGTPYGNNNPLCQVVVDHIGPIMYVANLPNFDNGIVFRGNVRIVEYYGSREFTQNVCDCNGEFNFTLTCKQLIQDQRRNNLVVQYILDLYTRGMNIIVFFAEREHIDIVHAQLSAIEGAHLGGTARAPTAREYGKLKSDESAADIQRAIAEARIILATYCFMSTGIDVPRLDSMITATPRATEMAQTNNRITRASGNAAICRQYIDIVDMNIPVIRRQFDGKRKAVEIAGNTIVPLNRKQQYESAGYILDYVQVKVEEEK